MRRQEVKTFMGGHALNGLRGFRAKLVYWLTILCCLVAYSSELLSADPVTLRQWEIETYNEINRTLAIPDSNLFAETASLSGSRSGGLNGRAFIWPESTQFRVLNTLAQINATSFRLELREFSDALHSAYWNN